MVLLIAVLIWLGSPTWAGAAPAALDLQAGQALYATQCALCHGPSGQGDGPSAAGYATKPSNLADGRPMNGPSAGFEGLVAKPSNLVGQPIHEAAVGEVRGLGSVAGGGGAVALPRRAVTECALRGIERLARLEIERRWRRAGPGGRPQPDEDRDEKDHDTETEAELAPCPGRAGVHATP